MKTTPDDVLCCTHKMASSSKIDNLRQHNCSKIKSNSFAGGSRSTGDVHLKNTKARHPQSRAVHAHAGHVKGQPLKVQLPPCLASPEDSPVASTSQPMSVIEAFTGATVLVTGGTGYLGSLVRN